MKILHIASMVWFAGSVLLVLVLGSALVNQGQQLNKHKADLSKCQEDEEVWYKWSEECGREEIKCNLKLDDCVYQSKTSSKEYDRKHLEELCKIYREVDKAVNIKPR